MKNRSRQSVAGQFAKPTANSIRREIFFPRQHFCIWCLVVHAADIKWKQVNLLNFPMGWEIFWASKRIIKAKSSIEEISDENNGVKSWKAYQCVCFLLSQKSLFESPSHHNPMAVQLLSAPVICENSTLKCVPAFHGTSPHFFMPLCFIILICTHTHAAVYISPSCQLLPIVLPSRASSAIWEACHSSSVPASGFSVSLRN